MQSLLNDRRLHWGVVLQQNGTDVIGEAEEEYKDVYFFLISKPNCSFPIIVNIIVMAQCKTENRR